MGWETPGYERHVQSALSDWKKSGRDFDRKAIAQLAQQYQSDEIGQTYLVPYLAETGDFLEYQRGMSL